MGGPFLFSAFAVVCALWRVAAEVRGVLDRISKNEQDFHAFNFLPSEFAFRAVLGIQNIRPH